MKTKSIKKLFASVLVVSMLMGSALTVSASDPGAGTSDPSASGSAQETVSSVVTGGSAEVSESSPAEAAAIVSANKNVSVAGKAVTNTIAGSFLIKGFQGAAVVTPLAEVKANLGLKDGQTPYIIAFDTDAKKSKLAMDCVNAAAAALGGNVVSAINVTLNARENGKWITLANGGVALTVGIPRTADLTKTYYAVCVQPGGVVTILNDLDASPATVTFEIKAGIGTYAVIGA